MATVTRRRALTLIACGLLAGCGLTQTVTDGTVSITKSIFYRNTKKLHLDFTPCTAINADGCHSIVRHDAVTTEVVMAYSNSNIDLPYIAYALHDSPA